MISYASEKKITMTPYRNKESGIEAFEPGYSYINLRFKGGKKYEYKSSPIASRHIAEMKRLAESGDGLNTYINENRDVYNAGKQVS